MKKIIKGSNIYLFEQHFVKTGYTVGTIYVYCPYYSKKYRQQFVETCFEKGNVDLTNWAKDYVANKCN